MPNSSVPPGLPSEAGGAPNRAKPSTRSYGTRPGPRRSPPASPSAHLAHFLDRYGRLAALVAPSSLQPQCPPAGAMKRRCHLRRHARSPECGRYRSMRALRLKGTQAGALPFKLVNEVEDVAGRGDRAQLAPNPLPGRTPGSRPVRPGRRVFVAGLLEADDFATSGLEPRHLRPHDPDRSSTSARG